MQQTAAKPWIIDLRMDTVFFIATPLLIVPFIELVRMQVSVAQIGMLVAALGSTGHHLPGMIRAYGDRELFQRFKQRFILGPVFLLLYCVGLANINIMALSAIVVLWGAWHGLAQVFGFVRIYDARVGSNSHLTSRLDYWMCIAWFGAGFFFSDGRMADLLQTLYAAGCPLIPSRGIHGFQSLWGLSTAAVTLAFGTNFIINRRRGTPASPLKLPVMISSFGFWWYSMITINSAILGIAIFEIFHDVQYLALTWIFNRERVESKHPMGRFSRFLFKTGRLKIFIYSTLCFIYGYTIHMVGELGLTFGEGTISRSLVSVVAASTMLHFYYDGFIWKIRERSTRSSLGLEGGGSDQGQSLRRGLVHALKWGLLVVPALCLIIALRSGSIPLLDQRRSVVEVFPTATTHLDLGITLLKHQFLDQADEEFHIALDLDPSSRNLVTALFNLGNARFRRGEMREAVDLYREAIALAPDSSKIQIQLDRTLAVLQNSEK